MSPCPETNALTYLEGIKKGKMIYIYNTIIFVRK